MFPDGSEGIPSYIENMGEPLVVYVLPVSGGGFPTQIGLLAEYGEARQILQRYRRKISRKKDPDLVLASSGGNVAAYLGLAADWEGRSLLRIASRLYTEMFIQSWFPSPFCQYIPTWMAGIFYGSFYRQGVGSEKFFHTYFNRASVSRTEIWTGTYDHYQQRAQFFCNKCEGQTLISNRGFDEVRQFYSCLPLRFLGADLSAISRVSMASASIPLLVSRQHFDGTCYVDGGAMYSSPLTVFVSEIARLCCPSSPPRGEGEEKKLWLSRGSLEVTPRSSECEGRRLRLIYFCSYEMDVPRSNGSSITQDLRQILHANIVQDRAAAVDLLRQLCGEVSRLDYPRVETKLLVEILDFLEEQEHYVLILYPHGQERIELSQFSGEQICDLARKTRQAYGAIVWYSSSGRKG